MSNTEEYIPEFVGDTPEVEVVAEPEPPTPRSIVRMYPPGNVAGYADVTRRAFDEVWQDKGWTLNPPPETTPTEQEEE